jgi:electron transport complex protein RnfB
MEPDIYRRLQKHLDKMPVPFSETDSGVEIKLLKHLFTEEEAAITLHLSSLAEPVSKINKRIKNNDYTLEELDGKLFKLYLKGAISAVKNPLSKGGGFSYSVMPLVVGMYESQVDRLTDEFARDYHQWEEEGQSVQILGKKTKQMRTIPVNVDIEIESRIGNYDDVTNIIQGSDGPFAVMNCICRQTKDKLGHNCKLTDIRETCVLIEKGAQFNLNRNTGREITKQEALQIINLAKKEGMILQSENSQKPNFICCCCGCCCGVLNAAKKYPRPSDFLNANYYAQVNQELCTICENCIDRCQMEAVTRVNNHAEVNPERCIGCGVCVSTCEGDAMELIRKEHVHIPPRNRDKMYTKIYFERYGILKTARSMGKVILGQQI